MIKPLRQPNQSVIFPRPDAVSKKCRRDEKDETTPAKKADGRPCPAECDASGVERKVGLVRILVRGGFGARRRGRLEVNDHIGKTLGVLGLGAIGRKVAKSANALGMDVIGYDPYLSDAAKAEIPFVGLYNSMEEIYEKADYITIHMPLTPELKGFMNADSFAKMKDGVIIINAARGELVNTSDIKDAIETGKVRCYVVDFPDLDCINCKNIVPTPHLGASTEEAEDNCAIMAAEELKEYLEKGNVINSVNFPNLKVELTKKHRVTVISEDAGAELVKGAVENAKGGIRYSILDSDEAIDVDSLKKLAGVIKVREIC